MKLNKQPFIAALLVLASLLLGTLPVSAQLPPQGSRRVHIVVLGTTDQHGNLFPVDYYTDKADNRGLAKIATLVRQTRSENKNVLLIDSGDTIQGTPLEYYHNKKNNAPPDPMMLGMNALGYDAMAVGNGVLASHRQTVERVGKQPALAVAIDNHANGTCAAHCAHSF